jgi:hypothetical protein
VVLTVANPRRAATPGTRCSLGRQDFTLRHCFGPFAQGGPVPAAGTGTSFVLLGATGGACRTRSARQRPYASKSKITGWRSRYHHHYITHCTKVGKSMICALVRHPPRFESADQGRPCALGEPAKGVRAMKPALRKRGRGPGADALSPSGPSSGAAHAGSCSARRRKRPSAMRRAFSLPWRRAGEPGSRLRRRRWASRTPVAYSIIRGGLPVRRRPDPS